jgi:hypothetical protein
MAKRQLIPPPPPLLDEEIGKSGNPNSLRMLRALQAAGTSVLSVTLPIYWRQEFI